MARTKHVRILLSIAVLVLGLSACQSPSGATPTADTPSGPPTASSAPVTPTPAELPPSPESIPAETAQVPPTELPVTPSLSPETRARQLRIFTQLWEAVRDTYVYADFNGVDWDQVGRRYRSLIEAGLSDDAFHQAMYRMIDELGDEHSTFLSPKGVAEEEERLTGDLDYVGIGIYTTDLVDEGYAVLLLVFPGSPAERAGLLPHDHILAVEGTPVISPDGTSNLDLLTGPEGTSVSLTARTPGQEPRQVTVTRQRIQTQLPIVSRRLPDTNVGYLLIPSFLDRTVSQRVGEALETLMAAGDLDGLIIDMRINGGGLESELRATLAYFVDGELGHFHSRQAERPLQVNATPIGNSQTVPLALLVSQATESYAETFCGLLQESRGAWVVGQTTYGNIETLWSIDLEDGSRAWIARESFRPPSGTDWEETGIVPDVNIPLGWDEFTTQDDPQLQAALELLLGSGS